MKRTLSCLAQLGAALGAMLVACSPAVAFELLSPVNCKLGAECFIQQTVDRDPGPEAEDFQCGGLTYDGHKGVDFGLPSLAEMAAGVDVLAAQAGIVRAVRDNMIDHVANTPDAPDIKGRECGNGLVIDHGDGWSSQYCHMRQHSLAVRPEDQVEAGQRLGQIGLSGQTEFPHLHFMLRKGDQIIDPFDGEEMAQPCTAPAKSGGLWAASSGVEFAPGGALSAGMLDRVPDYSEVRQSAPNIDALDQAAPAVVFWAHFYGLHGNDRLVLKVTGPNGRVFVEETHVMNRNRATQFRAIGRRKPRGDWPVGYYSGTADLQRDGVVISRISASLVLR